MSKVQIRRCYRDRSPVAIEFPEGHGRTKQAFKAECDINQILARYDSTGLITHVNRMQAWYGDFTEVNEYQQAMNTVIKAQEMFGELPSRIRAQFDNDPGQFLEFASNPENLPELRKMGLAKALEDQARPRLEPEEPAAKPAESGDGE